MMFALCFRISSYLVVPPQILSGSSVALGTRRGVCTDRAWGVFGLLQYVASALKYVVRKWLIPQSGLPPVFLLAR